MSAFIDRLQEIVSSGEVLTDEPMKKHTTFRIGGNADILIYPKKDEVAPILALAKEHEIPVTIIGNGSNLLVGDGGIRGLVLIIAKGADRIEVDDAQLHAMEHGVAGKIHMVAEAGVLLSKLAAEAARHSLSGLEFAAGIPGTVGGAVVMNAGAYGGEMKDVLTRVTVLTPEGEVLQLSAEELDLSYRHSCIPERGYIVLEAEFALEQAEEAQIRATMEDYKGRRIDKQPLEYPSAGSTFKRPEGYFAGKLIQDAGLRGYRVGGAQVSEKHCGFVINCENASAADVLQLIQDVKQRVYEEFQVELEPEVKMIGEF